MIFETVLFQSLFGFVSLLLINFNNWSTKYETSASGLQKESYDFIIVGAGSAGSVLANRLSEKPHFKVLLLEAGGDPTNISEIPFFCRGLAQTEMDWQYESEPQNEACFGLNNRKMLLPRGKVLGGTSILNYMIYSRGNRRDYDQWAALNNTGWSFEDVLPYFKKSEDNQDARIASDVYYHNNGGLLTVESIPYKTPMADAFLKAVESDGYPIRFDQNGEYQTGVAFLQGTLRRGARCSTNKAFIQPAKSRENLTIRKNAHVLKILFNTHKRAYAVVYEDNNRGENQALAVAHREIILSAGAFGSPQILMLSGVGPKRHLESLGIDVVADLPGVGENLQDHITTNGLGWTINQPLSFMPERVTQEDYAEWEQNGTGMLTVPAAGAEGIAFYNTEYANDNDDWPDIELVFLSASPTSDKGKSVSKLIGLSNDTWEKYYLPYVENDTFSILPLLLRPRSVGYIRLRSSDPKAHPIINSKYLSDPYDVAVLVAAMKKSVEFGSSAPFRNFGAKFFETLTPGCESHEPRSDAYWECLLRHQTYSLHHPIGTSKMGPKKDAMAVVDAKLRVYKVSGLRVVDASIMPTMISGHTNAPTIMIAEKAADMIKASYYMNIRTILVANELKYSKGVLGNEQT